MKRRKNYKTLNKRKLLLCFWKINKEQELLLTRKVLKYEKNKNAEFIISTAFLLNADWLPHQLPHTGGDAVHDSHTPGLTTQDN